jgi:FAD/FMN-containing dehydrogenase
LADIVAAVKSANPSQFDFIDGDALKWIQKNTGIKPLNTLKAKDPAGLFVIELDDGDGAHSRSARKLGKMLEQIGAIVQLAETVDDKEDIWAIRYALNVLTDDKRRVVNFGDAVVPVKNIERFYQLAKKLIKARKFVGFVSGRIGEGNLGVTALLDLAQIGDRQAALGTAKDLYSLAGRLGGEIAGDSGDGRLRQKAAAGQYDDEALGIFEKVKAIFDPKGILNPGVIIDGDEQGLIAKLDTQPVKRFLDYRPRV